jgi:hypothetical protein
MKSPYVREVVEINGKRYLELVDHCGWKAGDKISFRHQLPGYTLNVVTEEPGITIMADHGSTGIWDYQTRYMLEYKEVPEFDEEDINLIKLFMELYETWPWDSDDAAEIESAKNGYGVALLLKSKHPEMNIYFYNYQNVVKEVPAVFDSRAKVELMEIKKC